MTDVIRNGRQEPMLPGRELDGDRLTAIIESRMSGDLAWLGDDGKTITRMNPEQVGWALAHLYRTGDVVSGLPPQDIEQAEARAGLDVAAAHQYGHSLHEPDTADVAYECEDLGELCSRHQPVDLAAAIRNVLAYGASPPEYPGLALVPQHDLERLRAAAYGGRDGLAEALERLLNALDFGGEDPAYWPIIREPYEEFATAAQQARAALAPAQGACSVCGQEFPHYHRDTADGDEIVRVPASPPPQGEVEG